MRKLRAEHTAGSILCLLTRSRLRLRGGRLFVRLAPRKREKRKAGDHHRRGRRNRDFVVPA